MSLEPRHMTLTFSSGLDRLTEHNKSFDKGVLRVCYVGANRNGSYIGKDVFDRCMPSIYNCPIVCRYDRDADEIGAHDMELVEGENGSLRLVNMTTPIGVIPESANCWYEQVEEEDGATHEYLCVDALLWKRQEAYQKIKADGVTDQSMEISVQEGGLRDGVFVIDRFEFNAFCLLGTAEPCYESASLLAFSQDEFKSQMNDMMREFKESMETMQSPKEVEIEPKSDPKGGNNELDEKMNLMQQYGLTQDELDFDLNDFPIEELKEKFETMKSGSFALAEQFREELVGALEAETVETAWGTMNRYWYVDYDGGASEVYCYDHEDWKLYGFTYATNGDHVTVDFASKKRMKFSIVPFDEGEQPAVFADVYSRLSNQLLANDEQWQSKYQQAEQSIGEMQAELAELRQYKTDIEHAEAEQAREELFARFEDLNGVETFETLRCDCAEMSIDDLEEKCFAIRGRNQQQVKFSVKEPKAPKLPIEREQRNDEPYGGVFAKYGIHAD